MKNLIKTIALAATILVVTLSSCMKAPMACTDASTKTATVGTSVSFDASCSMGAHHYEWMFGDGATGSGASTTHVYNTKGSYTCTVKTLSNNMNKEDSKTIAVTIN
ncbi:MAG: PKD domain-containing protein [Bacteroidia bacterium]|nr:PKD domain-containing protein [Bacteroidia bacterium]